MYIGLYSISDIINVEKKAKKTFTDILDEVVLDIVFAHQNIDSQRQQCSLKMQMTHHKTKMHTGTFYHINSPYYNHFIYPLCVQASWRVESC